jgi:hypothetical protein
VRVRVAAFVVVCIPAVAAANPRILPFTYPTDTRAQEEVALEQLVDAVPLRAGALSGDNTTYLAAAVQSRISVALTDRIELGGYVSWVANPRDFVATATSLAGTANGVGQWLRLRINDVPDVWPVVGNVGVLAGVAENDREIQLQGRVLFERRASDRLRIALNAAFAYALQYSHQRVFIAEPSAGATYEVSTRFYAGIEGWLRYEHPNNPPPADDAFAFQRQIYVGPVLALHLGKLWWTVGAYGRATQRDHELVPGEAYGKLWVRSMIGIELR